MAMTWVKIANLKGPQGDVGGWARTPNLLATDNMDNLGSGFYQVLNGSTVAAALGLPTASVGAVESFTLGTQVVQRYTPSSGVDAGKAYTRSNNGTTWTAWARDADQWYLGGSSLTTSSVLDSLTNGVHTVWNGTTATTIGLPEAALGVVESVQFGTAGLQKFTTTSGLDYGHVWLRNKSSGSWFAWKRIDAGAAVTAPAADVPGSGFKTVPLTLTLGSSGGDAALSASVRLPLNFAAPISRWRVRIRNINPRYGTVRTGAVSFTGLWYGAHAGGGAFSAAPTQIQGAFTTSADGSLWTSQWFSDKPLGSGASYLLSFGYTAPSAPWDLVGGSWQTATPGDASATAPAMSISKTAPFDIWIEAETYATTPVIAGFGDSLTCGVGSTLPVHDSPLSQYCRGKAGLPVHYAASGDSMTGWADSASYKWTRWNTLARPDAVLFAMGSNDVFGGADLPTMQARHAVASAQVKSMLSGNIYAATIMPRTAATGAMETVRRDYNTWLRTQPNGIRDVFDFAASISTDDETITPVYDYDGIHLTTDGYAQNAAAITRPVTTPPVMYAA